MLIKTYLHTNSDKSGENIINKYYFFTFINVTDGRAEDNAKYR